MRIVRKGKCDQKRMRNHGFANLELFAKLGVKRSWRKWSSHYLRLHIGNTGHTVVHGGSLKAVLWQRSYMCKLC